MSYAGVDLVTPMFIHASQVWSINLPPTDSLQFGSETVHDGSRQVRPLAIVDHPFESFSAKYETYKRYNRTTEFHFSRITH